jgi:hypothetical protein
MNKNLSSDIGNLIQTNNPTLQNQIGRNQSISPPRGTINQTADLYTMDNDYGYNPPALNHKKMMSEMMSSVDNSIQDVSGISKMTAGGGKKYIKKQLKANGLAKEENGAPEVLVIAEAQREADMDRFIED